MSTFLATFAFKTYLPEDKLHELLKEFETEMDRYLYLSESITYLGAIDATGSIAVEDH